MSDEAFKRFLEAEARRKPLRIEGFVDRAEVLKDAETLATKISLEDYQSITRFWQSRSFASVASVLRKYGLEFKGITYMEALMNELLRMRKTSTGSP